MNIPIPQPEAKINVYKIICTFCHKETPEVSLVQSNNQIFIKEDCKCGKTGQKEIKEYLKELEKNDKESKNYCQKKGGSHKNIEAVIKLKGLYYCTECFDNLKEIIDPENFINITVIQCEEHNNPFKYYCKNCKKNMCETCNTKEHKNLRHSIEYLSSLRPKIDKKKFDEEIKDFEFFINTELKNIKNNIIKKLKKLIDQLDKAYDKFVESKTDFINLKKIFSENFFKSQDYFNYEIINNFIRICNYTYQIPEKIKSMKNNKENEEINSDNIIDLSNNYKDLIEILSLNNYSILSLNNYNFNEKYFNNIEKCQIPKIENEDVRFFNEIVI